MLRLPSPALYLVTCRYYTSTRLRNQAKVRLVLRDVIGAPAATPKVYVDFQPEEPLLEFYFFQLLPSLVLTTIIDSALSDQTMQTRIMLAVHQISVAVLSRDGLTQRHSNMLQLAR